MKREHWIRPDVKLSPELRKDAEAFLEIVAHDEATLRAFIYTVLDFAATEAREKVLRARHVARVTEIGMAYLMVPGEAQKQYAIEAILTLLTGSASVVEFRTKFNLEGKQWVTGRSA